MKRTNWLLLLGAVLVGPGCQGLEKVFWEREATPAKESAPPQPPPPVTAEQVSEADPWRAFNALSAELDRAAGEPSARPTPPERPKP